MPNAIVLGSFDGVHLGHRAVIAAAKGYNCIAVTFSLPPKIFTDNRTQLIMPLDVKCEQLKKCGVDEIYLMEFEKVKDMGPIDFLRFLKGEFSPELIACGFNYRFGRGASGNTELLNEFCLKEGIASAVVPCVEADGNTVSSSYIRSLIAEGNVDKANELLPCNFGFTAEVVNGDHRGRTIGFPTINQNYPKEMVKPKFGVYESRVSFDNKTYPAVTNLGIRPTFRVENAACETYIPGFSGNLYGKQIKLSLKRFLREEHKFTSAEELKNAIENDVEALRTE